MFPVRSTLICLPLLLFVACSGGSSGGANGSGSQPISNDTGAIAGFWNVSSPGLGEDCWRTVPGYIGKIGPKQFIAYYTDGDFLGPVEMTATAGTLSIKVEGAPVSLSFPMAESSAFDGLSDCDYSLEIDPLFSAEPPSLEEVPPLEARDVTAIAGIFDATYTDPVSGTEIVLYLEIKPYGIFSSHTIEEYQGTICLVNDSSQISSLGDNQYLIGSGDLSRIVTASVNDGVMTTSISQSGEPLPRLNAVPKDVPSC